MEEATITAQAARSRVATIPILHSQQIMMVHAFHPLGRPIQVHLRGGAGADVEVETVHATRVVAEAAVSVEEDTASPAPMNALSSPFRTVAVLSAHWA